VSWVRLVGFVRVSQGCPKGVRQVLDRCKMGVRRVLQERHKGVTRVSHSFTRKLQGRYKGIARVLQGCGHLVFSGRVGCIALPEGEAEIRQHETYIRCYE
jgi:hypothetical protein